jgi:hypothetical protein
MRVGRGDRSTDDSDVCRLRTVRHTRPEVESMCVHLGVWVLERREYMYVWYVEHIQTSHEISTICPTCGPPHQANHHTGAVWLICHH